MYRTPEIVDLYSNFPIGEKQDIWVRLRRWGAWAVLPVSTWEALGHSFLPAHSAPFPPVFLPPSFSPSIVFKSHL